jgi:hypothetical protein
MTTHKDTNELDEHYLRAGEGTQTACSCGKSFALSGDAQQHIEWQIRTQALCQSKCIEARIDELEKFKFNRSMNKQEIELVDNRIKELSAGSEPQLTHNKSGTLTGEKKEKREP